MYRIVILEDQAIHAEKMIHMLEAYEKAHPGMQLAITHYDRPLQLLSEYRRNVDLLLLDIQTPDMLGIDLAKKIRAMDDQVIIVFTTSLLQYAIEGYEVNAFDYIMKPLTQGAFHAKLDRVFRVLEKKRESAFLEVRSKTDVRRIPARAIVYIEVANHDLLVHLEGEVVRQWGSLKECEEQLQAAPFVRCNACYLVNMEYVREIHGEYALVGKDELSISRPRRKEFLAAVAQYKGGSR